MVRGKIRLSLARQRKHMGSKIPIAVHALWSSECREEYQKRLDECLHSHPHGIEHTAEKTWHTLKGCIVCAAEATVGRGRKKQPG